tara:strand:+ start:343 stop:606 length:264 start_codon:yes stop_codon:yes gene_type:complete
MTIKLLITNEEVNFLLKENILTENLQKIINSNSNSFSLTEEEALDLEEVLSEHQDLIGFDPETGDPNGKRGLLIESIIDKLYNSMNK